MFNYYVIKMNGTIISIPNEVALEGLEGYREFAAKLRKFYPRTEIKIYEVLEKLIED